MKKDAKFWETFEEGKVQCKLCNHFCKIDDGKTGICNVRKNECGKLYTLIYGSCSSNEVDPIEKKPLYHFYPGTDVLSIGTVGCNFKCKHCQNASISTADVDSSHFQEVLPEQVVDLAKKNNCQGIAFTYNEPTIWHEFAYDTSKLAKKEKLYTVYVSNGYIAEEPLTELSKYLDAINIDVKSFTENFYKKICKARLEPVLDTCEIIKNLGIHLELTYLVIPGYNDSIEEVKKFCGWVVDKLGNETPVHFSRFHPDFQMMDVEATPMKTLTGIYEIAKEEGILYPYVGNVSHGEYENTICPNCGNVCIERCGFSANMKGMKDGKCRICGKVVKITN